MVSAAAAEAVSQVAAIPTVAEEEVSKLIYKGYLTYRKEHIIGFRYFLSLLSPIKENILYKIPNYRFNL